MKRLSVEPATIPEPNTGCLLWLGWLNKDGYGMVRPPGTRQAMLAHRWTWIETFGPIPEGLTVDHRCRMRSCVEVRHLQLVTAVENTHLVAVRRSACPRCGGEWSRNSRQRICPACQARYFQAKDQEPERKAKREARYQAHMERYRTDPVYREKYRAAQRKWYTERQVQERGVSS